MFRRQNNNNNNANTSGQTGSAAIERVTSVLGPGINWRGSLRGSGGVRIEDDLLITKDGCRFLGEQRIPYHPKDVEEFMMGNENNNY